ncbi:MAG: GntR family transcriptional regulator [Lautropia sp.]
MNRPEDISLHARGPLYKEVKRRLTEAIGSGHWKPGAAIPPEPRLAEHFGVSIGTLRKAIDELVAENVLLRQQGRGTFVASHRGEAMRFLFFNLIGRDGTRRWPDEVRLESFGRERADEGLAASLRIAPRAPVLAFRNTLWLDGRAVAVDDIRVAAAAFPGLTRARLAQRDNTIYHLYEYGFGISVTRIEETLAATPAPADVAALLGVKPGAPLLEVHRIAWTLNDRPVESRVSWIDTTHHEYRREARSR